MGMASGLNMAGVAGTAGTARMSTPGWACAGTMEGTAGVVGTVGLADGRHSEHEPWQTLWVQRAWREWSPR